MSPNTVVDFGHNVNGVGLISTPNNSLKPLVNNGALQGTSATDRITLDGYVKGVGTFDNVTFTGTFSPGLSPTILSVGNIALSPTSILIMELGGSSAGSGYDQIQASGALLFDGTLRVSLINGFTPTAGQSFNLFDWISKNGTFDTLDLPALALGLAWDQSDLYITGKLSIDAVALHPDDFDSNGDVDGADFVAWQTNFPKATGATLAQGDADSDGDVDGADFVVWQTNFPFTAGPGAAPVPEPTAFILALAAVTTIGCWRRRAS